MNGTELVKNLNSAFRSRKLYPAGHPATVAPVTKALQALSEPLDAGASVVIGLLHGALAVDDHLLADGEKLYPEILGALKVKSVDAVVFERGVTTEEVSALIDVFSSLDFAAEELKKAAESRGITHIKIKCAPGERTPLEIYENAVETVRNVMGEIRVGKIPKSEPVNKIIGEMTGVVLSDPNAVLGLTMIKNYDEYLYNHSVNVSILALSLGRYMKLDEADLHNVGVGGLLHDIGKTGVAENIIRKPGGLSSEEWQKIMEHPEIGSSIVARMDGISQSISKIVYEHHVKYDHSGYPKTERLLNPLSQMITICDAYDALTTLRVYQKSHNPVEAIKVMANFSGKHFDPDVFKAFVGMIGVYPVGTMVRLSSNEIGFITSIGQGYHGMPVVKVLFDAAGAKLPEPRETDLAAERDKFIVTAVNPAATATDVGAFFKKEAMAKAS